MDKKAVEFHSHRLMTASMDLGWQIYAAIQNLELLQQVAAVGIKAIERELSKPLELGSYDPKASQLNDDLGAELSTIHSLSCMAMTALGYMGSDLVTRGDAWKDRHDGSLGQALVDLLGRNMDLLEEVANTMAIRGTDQEAGTDAMRWKLNELLSDEAQ